MRICLIYDSLQPYRIGGAELWYFGLAGRLAEAGHEVTYVTLRQWPNGESGRHPAARVIAVGPRLANYTADGRRTIGPPLLFGLGVFAHLLRHGRRYDVVHTSSFPYFSLLAAAAARPFGGYRIVVDWFEFWSRGYWRRYLGPLGWIGWTIQGLCLRVRQHAFTLARLTAERIRAHGVNGPVDALTGAYPGDLTPHPSGASEPLVVFAARLIPEKRLPLALQAIAVARRDIPQLRARIFGRGPDWDAGGKLIAELGLADAVEMADFVERPVLEEAMGRALCLLHPSEREGYGMVVVEAASRGTPSILVAGEDNAATELIEEGVNGFVAPVATAEALAAAIVKAHIAGPELRASTADWFARKATSLSIDHSMARVLASYQPAPQAPGPGKAR
jgi:glycosyltransferase involved in cell wall biosynthesis